MDIIKATGVNYDYILGLKMEDQWVKVVQYPILRQNLTIEKAIENYYDKECDAADVYNTIKKSMGGKIFPYCFGHDYTDHYITDIDSVEFDPYIYKTNLKNKLDARLKRYLYRLSPNDPDYTNKLLVLKDIVKADLYPSIKKDKNLLLAKALRYIYADDYCSSLIKYNIEKECIVFSNERHGDNRKNKYQGYHIEHRVNEDVTVKIETNFCYGSSTYFRVIVTYKGIPLLPYSVWVKYYYAGYSYLLRHTRHYIKKRESWHDCFNFLQDFINSAIRDPHSFIHNEVMHEVQGMMDGLERIFKLDPDKFQDELQVKRKSDDNRYIGIIAVRDAGEKELKEYKISPAETAMIYKMEKISGALRFLENLRELSEIYSEISKAIERIISMNQNLYPEVEAAIPPIIKEKQALTHQLSPILRRYSSCCKTISKFEDKLHRKLQNIFGDEKKKAIRAEFETSYPAYPKLIKEYQELYREKTIMEEKICKREEILKRLDEYRTLILRYAFR